MGTESVLLSHRVGPSYIQLLIYYGLLISAAFIMSSLSWLTKISLLKGIQEDLNRSQLLSFTIRIQKLYVLLFIHYTLLHTISQYFQSLGVFFFFWWFNIFYSNECAYWAAVNRNGLTCSLWTQCRLTKDWDIAPVFCKSLILQKVRWNGCSCQSVVYNSPSGLESSPAGGHRQTVSWWQLN